MWGCYPSAVNNYTIASMLPMKLPGKFSKLFSSIYDQVYALTVDGKIYMYGTTHGEISSCE